MEPWHLIPYAELDSVLVTDSGHEGTVVTRLKTGYLFSSLDHCTAIMAPRLVMLELSDKEVARGWSFNQDLPHALDLDSGWLLVGLELDADPPACGRVLWDSATEA